MPLSFAAAATTLGGLLQGPRCYCTPVFQRPYSWKIDPAEQLLDDTLNACFVADGETMHSYFIGNWIMVEPPPSAPIGQPSGKRGWGRSKKPRASPTLEVIDGKQRLITLTVLLAVIRDLLGADGTFLQVFVATSADLVKAGAEPYRITSDPDETRYLITCAQASGATLADRPADLPADTPGGERMLAVRDRFAKRLSGFEKPKLRQFARFLLERCELSMITTSDYDVAYQLFSKINNSGSELSIADVLKAEIIGDLPAVQRAEAARQWMDWTKRLGPRFERLFSHLAEIDPVDTANLIRNTLGLVEKAGGPDVFLNSLFWPSARNFEIIVKASYEGGEQAADINRRLTALGWWPTISWVPPVLHFLNREGGNPARVLEFLTAYEAFALRVNLRDISNSERDRLFHDVLDAMGQGLQAARPFDLSPKGPLALTVSEQQAALDAIGFNLYRKHQKACKAVLYRLNGVLDPDFSPMEIGKTSVEHVLSSNAKPGDPQREAFGTKAQFDRYAGSIGNLILLETRRNLDAERKPFPEKLKCYFKDGRESAFAMANELRGLTEWNPELVVARHERLMVIAQTIWRLSGDIRWRMPGD